MEENVKYLRQCLKILQAFQLSKPIWYCCSVSSNFMDHIVCEDSAEYVSRYISRKKKLFFSLQNNYYSLELKLVQFFSCFFHCHSMSLENLELYIPIRDSSAKLNVYQKRRGKKNRIFCLEFIIFLSSILKILREIENKNKWSQRYFSFLFHPLFIHPHPPSPYFHPCSPQLFCE